MNVRMNEKLDMIEVWVTRAEQQDSAIQEKLKSIYNQYATPKRRVAVFYSGQANLAAATKSLLTSNILQ